MNIEQLYEFCLSKKGVSEHFPFDEDTLVFKVCEKMFTLTSLKQWENNSPSINVKCNPDYAQELRTQYEGVKPAFHMNKVHWNTVDINSDVSDKLVFEFINNSYDLVFKSLTKIVQKEILKLEN